MTIINKIEHQNIWNNLMDIFVSDLYVNVLPLLVKLNINENKKGLFKSYYSSFKDNRISAYEKENIFYKYYEDINCFIINIKTCNYSNRFNYETDFLKIDNVFESILNLNTNGHLKHNYLIKNLLSYTGEWQGTGHILLNKEKDNYLQICETFNRNLLLLN